MKPRKVNLHFRNLNLQQMEIQEKLLSEKILKILCDTIIVGWRNRDFQLF